MKQVVLVGLLWLCSAPAWGMQLVERIVGGVNEDDPPPYLVYMRVEVPGGFQLCGASYIGEGRVLTAAHCLFDGNNQPSPNVRMYFNIPDGNIENLDQAVRIDSAVFETFLGYDNSQFSSNPARDAAVIFLPRAVPGGVQSVTLATTTVTDNATSNENIATAYGWGLTSSGGSVSDQLQAVELNLDRDSICQNFICSDFILYAGSKNANKDACGGDSGGPLSLTVSGAPLLVGLTSFGFSGGCAEPDVPGGYTRVSAIRNWALTVEPGRQVIETEVIGKRTQPVGEGSLSLGFMAFLILFIAYHRRRPSHKRER